MNEYDSARPSSGRRGVTRRCILAGAATAVLAPQLAAAQPAYPFMPVRIIVPFEAGGGGDIIVRLVGQELSKRLGQPVVVENRAGASGNVGTDVVAHSKPDGYTLGMANVAPMAINVSLFKTLPYNPKELTAISPLAVFANVLVVPPSLGVKTIAELVALGKTKPGGLTYASTGTGSITDLSAKMFASAEKLNMVQAAYRGGGPAVTALVGSQIDLYFASLPAALPYIKQKQLIALGVTSAHRSSSAPDVPTIAESGLPGFEAVTWIGLIGPAGIPAPIVAQLNKDVTEILADPALQEKLRRVGADASSSSSAAYAAYIASEIIRWSAVVKEAHIPAQ